MTNSSRVLADDGDGADHHRAEHAGPEAHGAGVGADHERQHDDGGGDQQPDEQLPLLAGSAGDAACDHHQKVRPTPPSTNMPMARSACTVVSCRKQMVRVITSSPE